MTTKDGVMKTVRKILNETIGPRGKERRAMCLMEG